jgi:CRISPR-associated endonuclease/helicase Cas3
MSKLKRQRPYIFGRVFFPEKVNGDPAIPNKIYFQPLGDHVGNVVKLVEFWSKDDFPCESSLGRVKEAAKIHDTGKPQKFELRVETTRKNVFKKYIYSFRGHRYLAESKNAWVQSLAKGHHDYSVGDISRDTYQLKKHPEYAEILSIDSLAYAKELYILEMCDQIEAELACRVIGDEEQAESRTFMEYTIQHDDKETNVYRIEPWIFQQEEIELDFKYWAYILSEQDKKILKECRDNNKDFELGKKLDKLAKNWWNQQPEKPEIAQTIKIQLKPFALEQNHDDRDYNFWYKQLANFSPNPLQKEIYDKITTSEAPDYLIKAPTGSGKFETILFPALAKRYRLILPLPARSLIEDQKQRLEQYLKRVSQIYPQREISLIIDTGSQMRRWIYVNGEVVERHINPRRHLYKGDIILTTLDKFMYRYFAFGDKQKSFIFPLRIHKEKTIICFDEAHTYDEISFTNFHSLVTSLYEAGRSIVLMTATMPKEYIQRFDYLEVIDYVDNEENRLELEKHQNRTQHRDFEWINDIERNSQQPKVFQTRIVELIKAELQIKHKLRIITVVETVKDAVEIYQNLKLSLDKNQNLLLYHGRLDSKQRERVYQNLKKRDDNNQPYILITTSAIEVGCDLNSEVLISQICLPENLIQRAGRCNRKGNIPDAKVIVVGKVEIDRIPFYAASLDESGWNKYQGVLSSLSIFDAQKIGDCISRPNHVDDYRVVELFSMLHEYVYNADLTCQPTHEKGLVVTRSWTPSATLVYDDGTHGENWINKLSEIPHITVPLDRLIIKKDEEGNPINQYANTYVYERYYDQEETRYRERNLRWGCAYQKDIFVKISPEIDGASTFDGKLGYHYEEELGFVELPSVFQKWRTQGFEEKLQYKYDETDKKTSAVISFIKSIENIS